MRVVVLGTAAGGGFPQWNCACRLCAAGRAGSADVPARTQDCLAVSAGDGWYLVNASPDIRAQVLAADVLAPGPGPRDTPLRGALLTDAELDHTMGLLMLREGGGLRVFAPRAVLSALEPVRDTVARYGSWTWSSTVDIPGLAVTTFAVSDKKPRYAAGSTASGPWVVAYRITDPATGGALVYAPCLRSWLDGFDEFVDGAAGVLLDGTFYSPAEMSGTGTSTAAQRAMGHVPIDGPDGSLVRIAKHSGIRWCYTHLNNTNPVLDRRSPEYAVVRDAGVEVPLDGTAFEV
ncbi:pyrroloquinoline quinone biosynthesis protein PqqB [Actinophytocola algeriensis]|uniref:Coenzyme PQQ synthesis protein B n=1 Tax=Actinophytocola algeriensis TaxID=1768010 RepID=A0A7W7Q9A3_9PSEU|nr:pyrroloquinoline quinone biosynthesis protein PqqB [Actinophytocola algeriensis]MBB4908966.1 pyrroloquinoline quinone biosynthesis protein B [Actinophytocola algeriensis]MBE1474646.1 pyrroloquinoline quinone biosynthesis protein B [Actinophytocola algeriensis]